MLNGKLLSASSGVLGKALMASEGLLTEALDQSGVRTKYLISWFKLKEMDCAHCGLMFTDQTLYLLHKGLHSEADPWRCNLCGQTCSDKYTFTTHMISSDHTHSWWTKFNMIEKIFISLLDFHILHISGLLVFSSFLYFSFHSRIPSFFCTGIIE